MELLKNTFLVVIVALLSFNSNAQNIPKPSVHQLRWQQLETTAFIHFTVNTFTDREWGDGKESPKVFNPEKLDARQWIKTLKDAGFKMAIITAKHHDGFCLWPSQYTKHSVKYSPWKNGQGDVVKDVANACREFGLKFGFYLSPWDMHERSYGTNDYNTFYKNQLRELLTNYGDVSEVWFDGAKGENAKDMNYDFASYWKLVKTLQPKAVLFSDAGPDVRWVGNESGNAGETCWSTIDTAGLAPGKADSKYLNFGDPKGKNWIPAETDVSIRPGWFYHASEDSKVKTPKELVNLYYQSVGRNSLLLLNIPPNTDGLFADQDVKNVIEFRKILNETFKTNLAKPVVNRYLTDSSLSTYVNLKPKQPFVVTFKKPLAIDRILLQENIAQGQKIEQALLEYWDGKVWKIISQISTVGYKRLIRTNLLKTTKIRFTVLKAKAQVQLAEVGFYKASANE